MSVRNTSSYRLWKECLACGEKSKTSVDTFVLNDGVTTQFQPVFSQKMSELMKSTSVRFGLIFTIFQNKIEPK